MSEGRPRVFGDLMAEWFQARENHPRLRLHVLRHHWEAIVGPELARKTHPERIARATLFINTLDPSWAYQLQFMKGELLQSVQAFLESTAIRELRFRMGEVPSSPDGSAPGEETHPSTLEFTSPHKSEETRGAAGLPPHPGFNNFQNLRNIPMEFPTESGMEEPIKPNLGAKSPAPSSSQPGEKDPGLTVTIADPKLRKSFARLLEGQRRKKGVPSP